MAIPRISLRLDFDTDVDARIGPGKIALLAAVATEHSISGAARRLGMSYRRAWLLVDALNRLMATPVVVTETGGRRGGGAAVTAAGRRLLASYREMERAVDVATQAQRRTLAKLAATKHRSRRP
jgi:molybdate transport system regulatory protein